VVLGEGLVTDEFAEKIIVTRIMLPSDYFAVATFLSSMNAANLTKEAWLEKFAFFWENNPYYDSEVHYRGWILTDEQGIVYGFLGNIPAHYVRQGETEICFWATTWFVSEDTRRHSLKLFSQFKAQKGVLFDTTPTPIVEAILKSSKFTSLDAPWMETNYIKPIHTQAVATYIANKSKFLKWFAHPFALCVCWLSSIKAFGWAKGEFVGSTKIKEISEPPSDIDIWWEAFQAKTHFTVVRDSMAMNWLFFDSSILCKRKAFEIRHDDNLIGFAIIKIEKHLGYLRAELVDLACLDISENVLRAMIDYIIRFLRSQEQRVIDLKFHAFSELMQDTLSRSGFWKVSGNSRFYFKDPLGELGVGQVYGTALDGDRSMFP
jgi:hypothetical protein